MSADEELLNFDRNRLADWSEERARTILAGEHADLYRNHLQIAKWIDGWIGRMSLDSGTTGDESYDEGFEKGIREIAAHLRQGDLIPGGPLLIDS